MSLRIRLMFALTAMLLIALAVGGVVVCLGAHASVQTEMRGALAGAVEAASGELTRPAAEAGADFTPGLVRRFDGQRHIRVTALRASGNRWAQSRPSPPGAPPPVWFRRLVGVTPRAIRLDLPSRIAPPGAALVIETDPTNEIIEVWRQTGDAVAIMVLFSGGAGLAIFLVVGQTLRRFERFESAFQAVAEGQHEVTLDERGPPEFVTLARGFNRMAGRIQAFQKSNRDLNEQILTLQAEERAEIARDLHDEVGPYLFAITVDAGDIPRLTRLNDQAGLDDRARSIREAAAHIQTHVRAILHQLRPTQALAFGLGAAIDDLITFWSRRCPTVAFSVEVALDGATIDARIEDVAYRVVQESLSNALRHGRPTRVTVAIVTLPGERLSITVTDDGAGLCAPSPRSGMGLTGMAERVRALDGDFEMTGAADGAGTRARARLPMRPERRPAALALS